MIMSLVKTSYLDTRTHFSFSSVGRRRCNQQNYGDASKVVGLIVSIHHAHNACCHVTYGNTILRYILLIITLISVSGM